MSRGYQEIFSSSVPAMYDREGRLRKAVTMKAVLEDFLDKPIKDSSILVAGGSTGIIDSYLAEHAASVISLDIDAEAIRFAAQSFENPNLSFVVGDAMNIAFPDQQFDIVICSQVYEHVPDANKLLAEIHRVLKPGGICYFAAGNRLNIMEPHYRLPFLSVLPKSLAHLYLRILGRSNQYYETHLSYWGLTRLVRKFRITDYSNSVIADPKRFNTDYMISPGSRKPRLALLICRYFFLATTGLYLDFAETIVTETGRSA